MNSQQEKQVKKLTWKYFRQQKLKEVRDFFIIVFIFYSVIIGIFAQGFWSVPLYYFQFPRWILVSGLVCDGIWLVFGLILWLENNYDKAKSRALKEVKRK